MSTREGRVTFITVEGETVYCTPHEWVYARKPHPLRSASDPPVDKLALNAVNATPATPVWVELDGEWVQAVREEACYRRYLHSLDGSGAPDTQKVNTPPVQPTDLSRRRTQHGWVSISVARSPRAAVRVEVSPFTPSKIRKKHLVQGLLLAEMEHEGVEQVEATLLLKHDTLITGVVKSLRDYFSNSQFEVRVQDSTRVQSSNRLTPRLVKIAIKQQRRAARCL